jgi:hypothetical protein
VAATGEVSLNYDILQYNDFIELKLLLTYSFLNDRLVELPQLLEDSGMFTELGPLWLASTSVVTLKDCGNIRKVLPL